MKQLLEDLAFYQAELDSAVEFDDLRGYYIFKDKINSIKKQIEIMEELDKKLEFNFRIILDNALEDCIIQHITDEEEAIYAKVAIKLAKDYATHCMEQQRILDANNADVLQDETYIRAEKLDLEGSVDIDSILNTPLYDGANYGQ
jgi:hypothetical protein